MIAPRFERGDSGLAPSLRSATTVQYRDPTRPQVIAVGVASTARCACSGGARSRLTPALPSARRPSTVMIETQPKKASVGTQKAIRPLYANAPDLKKIINTAGTNSSASQKLRY